MFLSSYSDQAEIYGEDTTKLREGHFKLERVLVFSLFLSDTIYGKCSLCKLRFPLMQLKVGSLNNNQTKKKSGKKCVRTGTAAVLEERSTISDNGSDAYSQTPIILTHKTSAPLVRTLRKKNKKRAE